MQRRHPAQAPTDRQAAAKRLMLTEGAVLYVTVALGSAIGGSLRAAASLAAPAGAGLPWATLFVNVAGSFAIGLYATLTGPDGRLLASARQRHFVMTGLCGGFTTFSIFSLEAVRFLDAGRAGMAGLTVALSVTLWLAAVWFGHLLARRLNRPGGR